MEICVGLGVGGQRRAGGDVSWRWRWGGVEGEGGRGGTRAGTNLAEECVFVEGEQEARSEHMSFSRCIMAVMAVSVFSALRFCERGEVSLVIHSDNRVVALLKCTNACVSE